MEQNNVYFTAKVRLEVRKYLSLKGNSAKNIYDDMLVTLGDKSFSYSTVKNWVARFTTGHLRTKDEERSGRPTQVTIPGNVDSIHSMILDDRKISAKNILIAQTLAISR
jgi:transposase